MAKVKTAIYLVGLLGLLHLGLASPAATQAKPKLLPVGDPVWQRPTLLDNGVFPQVDPGKITKAWVDKALAMRGEGAVIGGFRPAAVGNWIIYRTHNDVRAVVLTATQRPIQLKAGDIFWKSVPTDASLAILDGEDPAFGRGFRARDSEQFLKDFPVAHLPQLVLEHNLACSLSHDEGHAYYVDEWATPSLGPGGFEVKDPKNMIRPDFVTLFGQNGLKAVELKSGKLAFVIGDTGPIQFLVAKKNPFANSHFLGAPLPFKGKLYVANETNEGDIRLVVIDPVKGEAEATHPLDKVQGLERFLVNPRRRLHAAQIVAQGDLLAVLTHTGKFFGVEIPTLKVRWDYTYQKGPALKPKKLDLGSWKAPALFVGDGKVIFTAADDGHVHCVDLKTGKMVWKEKQADDLYLAGIAGDKVLLVGNSSCRALALRDGKELWKVATGTPSGIGAWDKTTYLLPLEKAATSKQPEIAYVDVGKGAIVGTSPLKEMPGNLLLHEGFLVSQSATTIAAYKR